MDRQRVRHRRRGRDDRAGAARPSGRWSPPGRRGGGGPLLRDLGACSLVKHVAERARPPSPPVRRTVALQDPYSMPSGHTAIATGIVAAICFTVWLGRGSHRVALGIGIPVVLVVAASRVFVGAHYLGDVTVAMLLGAGVCLLVLALGRGLGRITPDLQGSEPLRRPARRT
ncbi:phosphatase PAP2 family protein [Allobranchiibius sp. GilTou73]|uniref:phosphatase PAP2 family protein n=1 Tax=Allobranchiibius sp. GilTou73 TaxID=2904523 RepID=UPI0021055B07|nr:phosphatase PAP2 family protein [Allobranchiibius sp. GilTou73]